MSSPDPSAQREAVARAREASEALKAAARSMLPSGPDTSRPPSPLKRADSIAAPKHQRDAGLCPLVQYETDLGRN